MEEREKGRQKFRSRCSLPEAIQGIKTINNVSHYIGTFLLEEEDTFI